MTLNLIVVSFELVWIIDNKVNIKLVMYWKNYLTLVEVAFSGAQRLI